MFSINAKPNFSAYLGEEPRFLIGHWNEILEVNELLYDDESKEVYRELFYYYMRDDFVEFIVHPFKELYFDYCIYKKIEDEVFVDCGAFDGDTLEIFFDHNEICNKYIAIEADHTKIEKLKKMCAELNANNVLVYNEYIADCKKLVGFSANGTSYASMDDSAETIMAATLDELVYDFGPTFIKINVEGADLEAIKGAERIIRDYHPIIACQGHHKANHLWEIIETIREFDDDGKYRYYLRNYSGIMEFTFYAIPIERQH